MARKRIVRTYKNPSFLNNVPVTAANRAFLSDESGGRSPVTLRLQRVARTGPQQVIATALATAYDAVPNLITEEERAFLANATDGMLYHRVNMIEHYCSMPSSPQMVARTLHMIM